MTEQNTDLPTGLPNYRLNCWANSIIQALETINIKIYEGPYQEFLDNVGFGQVTEDAGEFLIFLIDKFKLESKFNLTYNKKLICVKCKKVCSNYDDVNMLTYCHMKDTLTKSGDTFLESFIRCHIEIGDGEYNCEFCKTKVKVLTIQNLTRKSNFIVVDLSYADKKDIVQLNLWEEYHIVAIVYYYGNHYNVKCKRGDKVYLFNDESVMESKFTVRNAALVFYAKNGN
jgi:hypothetical protein